MTEEREMTVIFLIDMSASLFFGSTLQTKAALAAEIVSVLAFSAIKNNDTVGMLTFTDKIEKIIRPKKGKNNIFIALLLQIVLIIVTVFGAIKILGTDYFVDIFENVKNKTLSFIYGG